MKILSLIILIFFISCKEKYKEDKIEFYLTKERIQSFDGVSIQEAVFDTNPKYDNNIKQRLIERYENKVRIDTLKKEIIFAGKFKVQANNLQNKPFIKDSEILGIDFENSSIHFKESVAKNIYDSIKIWRNKKHNYGRQFVLKHNEKIILNGYFFSMMSSQLSNTYQILFYPINETQKNDSINSVSYLFYEGLKFDKNLNKNKLLKKAFKDRVIK